MNLHSFDILYSTNIFEIELQPNNKCNQIFVMFEYIRTHQSTIQIFDFPIV